ncbi:MAG: hypothetical protein MK197_06415 [Candidatus Poseidoniaceae archaeon]|nr:hypothetical protein [Candidatus Poseidoniaceae archaeon]
MDPRHPNIAFAANTAALIAFVALLFSLFLPVGTPRGWGNIETGLLVLVPLSLALSWWARREHDVPVVHAHGSSAAQYEEMEGLPTMVSLDAAQDSVNPNTAAVIESIIGSQVTQEESAVDNAISALSKGQIGQSSAAAVSNNEVDRTKVNVDKFDSRGFQVDGIESIPLPDVPTLELPDVPVMADLPEMPDLDDLLNEDEASAAPPPLDLPELPDF